MKLEIVCIHLHTPFKIEKENWINTQLAIYL